MSEAGNFDVTRRELLKTVAGAAVGAGVAALGISSALSQDTQQSSGKEQIDVIVPETFGKEQIDVIVAKTKSVDDAACQYSGFAPGVQVIENGIRWERDVAVKMRDGVTVYIDIYRPEGNNLPAIVACGCVVGSKQPQEREILGVSRHGGSDWGLVDVSKYAKFEGPDPLYWCKHGYAVINYDFRGWYKSEGVGQIYGTQGGRDLYDLIEWIAGRDWSNGKVTLSGTSQLAAWQWMAAAVLSSMR